MFFIFSHLDDCDDLTMCLLASNPYPPPPIHLSRQSTRQVSLATALRAYTLQWLPSAIRTSQQLFFLIPAHPVLAFPSLQPCKAPFNSFTGSCSLKHLCTRFHFSGAGSLYIYISVSFCLSLYVCLPVSLFLSLSLCLSLPPPLIG